MMGLRVAMEEKKLDMVTKAVYQAELTWLQGGSGGGGGGEAKRTHSNSAGKVRYGIAWTCLFPTMCERWMSYCP